MKRIALAICLLCPSLAVADCASGSCSVADLVAAEKAPEKPVAAIVPQPAVVHCVPVRVRHRRGCRR